jgi:hypothetical protein
MMCGSVDLTTDAGTSQAVARPRSRVAALITLLNLILMAGLLYKTFGQSLSPSEGVTFALINSTAGPMLDLAFEYPGGKLSVRELGVRNQVAQSVTDVADFEGTLSFKDEQGHSYREKVRVRPYADMLVLLNVQPILQTSLVKTSDGKEEAVIQASSTRVLVVRSYQKPGQPEN